jgi:hypothetical protein
MKKLTIIIILSVFAACRNNQQSSPGSPSTQMTHQKGMDNDQLTQERLRRMDSLDFQFYNKSYGILWLLATMPILERITRMALQQPVFFPST